VVSFGSHNLMRLTGTVNHIVFVLRVLEQLSLSRTKKFNLVWSKHIADYDTDKIYTKFEPFHESVLVAMRRWSQRLLIIFVLDVAEAFWSQFTFDLVSMFFFFHETSLCRCLLTYPLFSNESIQ
jgi:hypothetical protein